MRFSKLGAIIYADMMMHINAVPKRKEIKSLDEIKRVDHIEGLALPETREVMNNSDIESKIVYENSTLTAQPDTSGWASRNVEPDWDPEPCQEGGHYGDEPYYGRLRSQTKKAPRNTRKKIAKASRKRNRRP